jgi:hypothetical protein
LDNVERILTFPEHSSIRPRTRDHRSAEEAVVT